MDRRAFLSLGAAGALGVLQAARPLTAASPSQDEIPYGQTPLGLSNDGRDGLLYVPKSYRDDTPMPALVMLHGMGGAATGVRYTFPIAEELGVIVIAPESRGLTWGQSIPGFDDDVRFIGSAYRHATDLLNVDRTHVALGGHSDGAGYALSMGLAYGDVFNHLMVFSAGLMIPFRRKGMPQIFIAHGVSDEQMPIDKTARRYVPQLKSENYDVTYREYEGGHGVPVTVVREAFEWFLADMKSK